MKTWTQQAPANIALIKYMGKKEGKLNFPVNGSLSYTLNHLKTSVEMEVIECDSDQWEPLVLSSQHSDLHLSEHAVTRFLQHLARIKEMFGYDGSFMVRSNNNFPQGAGIASSASSFAALTKCAVLALSELTEQPILSTQAQAQLSRMGSGSSCRSFYSPWCLWEGDEVLEIKLAYPSLHHQVVIIDGGIKQVSSSDAHQRVKTSPLFPERVQRAETRLKHLLSAFKHQSWKEIYQICLAEFMDMHQLFETASQPFSYMTPDCHRLVDFIAEHWRTEQDGPLITMDAGPTIHLLYRPDQEKLAQLFKETVLKDYVVL